MVTITDPPPYNSVHLEEGPEDVPPPDYTYDYDFVKPKEPVDSDSFDVSFKIDSPKYNDVYFTGIFYAVILCFIGLTVYCYNDLLARKSTDSPSFTMLISQGMVGAESETSRRNAKDLLLLLLATIGVPICCSLVSMLLAYSFPMVFVFLGYCLIPLSLFGSSMVMFAAGAPVAGGFMFFFGAWSLMFAYQNYSKLSFTALMLKIVVGVMKLHPSVLLISFLGAIASGVFGFFYLSMTGTIFSDRMIADSDASSSAEDPDNQANISGLSWCIYFFTIFVGYYVFEIIENLIHVVTSGAYGSWYFFEKSALKPRHPSWYAFKRAITFCFGSICFGSLVVSLVKIMRQVINFLEQKINNRRLENRQDGSNNIGWNVLSMIVSFFDFIFSQTEYWIKWFNQYAYSYLALYGETYLNSARDTFEIMKYKGIFILITDCLINTTLGFYSVLNCLISSGIFYAIITQFRKYTNVAPEFIVIGFVLQILLAYFITWITLNTINSGYITFLIALCIKPELFEQNYHDYFVRMTNYYPEISQSLNIPFRD